MGRDPRPTPQSRAATRTVELESRAPAMEVYHGGGGSITGPASDSAAAALFGLLTRDDGWLRISPKDDGATVYWKWKWTAGKHINHYVMAVYPASQSAEAVLMLAKKVNAVDTGVERPVKDHYFQ